MSDRLALSLAIEDAGIARDKAEAIATAITRFVEGNVATKADITRLEGRIDVVEGRIDLVEHRLLTRLGGLMIIVGGILFAALHVWPPHL